ncbi:hypothetical protein NL50_04420 [Clostridium acetobutylicum]|nr:hypothetical protein NL50_04420 [Clostridium acetobutylicum]
MEQNIKIDKSSKELRKMARQQLKGKWGASALILLVLFLISLSFAIPYVGYVIQIALTGALSFGARFCFLKIVRGEKPKVENLFVGFKNFVPSLVLYLLIYVFMLLWSLIALVPIVIIAVLAYYSYLNHGSSIEDVNIVMWIITAYIMFLIALIPAMIAAYRYYMGYYILIDNSGLGAYQALNESKKMMKGNKWKLFLLHLTFIGWEIMAFIPVLIYLVLIIAFKETISPLVIIVFGILVFLILIASMIFLLVYIETASANFYERLKALKVEE